MTILAIILGVLLVSSLSYGSTISDAHTTVCEQRDATATELATALDDLEVFQGLHAASLAAQSSMERDHTIIVGIMRTALTHALAGREDDALACMNELHTGGGT